MLYDKLADAIAEGLVASCHDCSDGGLGAALAESAFAGGYGMDVDLAAVGVESNAVALFSESQSRFVATVSTEKAAAFEAKLAGCPVQRVGEVIEEASLRMSGLNGFAAEAPLAELKAAWKSPMSW